MGQHLNVTVCELTVAGEIYHTCTIQHLVFVQTFRFSDGHVPDLAIHTWLDAVQSQLDGICQFGMDNS